MIKFIKKRLQHRCFPVVNFAKFLRTPIFKNIQEQLLLFKVLTFLRVDVCDIFTVESYQLEPNWCLKIMKVSLFSKVYDTKVKVFHIHFMFYLPMNYFKVLSLFLSAVLVDLVCWVMMDGHATIPEYCIIYLTTMLNSLTHIIT